VKSDPELAEKTFHRLLTSFNALSVEYGRLGSASSAAPGGGTAPRPPAAPAPQGDGQADLLAELYGPDRMEELKTKYGKDFMDDIVRPMLKPVEQLQAKAQRQEMAAVATEIGTFFRGLPKEFAEMYGQGADVSEEQFNSRAKLAQLADQIRYGAGRQGIELSVSECLERANLMFASEHIGQVERQRIKTQVQNRSRQLTQRPTQRRRPASESAPSEQTAKDAYAQRAAELGLDVAGEQ